MKRFKTNFITLGFIIITLLMCTKSFGQNDETRIVSGTESLWPTSARISFIDVNNDEYVITKNIKDGLSINNFTFGNIKLKPDSHYKIELLGVNSAKTTVQWYINIAGFGMELELQGRTYLTLDEYLSSAQGYSLTLTARVKSEYVIRTYNFSFSVGYNY